MGFRDVGTAVLDITGTGVSVDDRRRRPGDRPNGLGKLPNRDAGPSPDIVSVTDVGGCGCPEVRLDDIVDTHEVPGLAPIPIHRYGLPVLRLPVEDTNHATVVASGLPRAKDVEIPEGYRLDTIQLVVESEVVIEREFVQSIRRRRRFRVGFRDRDGLWMMRSVSPRISDSDIALPVRLVVRW